jgi:plastocyanin
VKLTAKEIKMKTSVAIFFFLFALISCNDKTYNSSVSGTSPVSTSDAQEVNCTGDIAGRVQIVARTFTPATLTVLQNEVVSWENTENETHTVTSGTTSAQTNVFDMTLNAGQERCLQFKRAGSFSYFCKIHPEMRGEILVR